MAFAVYSSTIRVAPAAAPAPAPAPAPSHSHCRVQYASCPTRPPHTPPPPQRNQPSFFPSTLSSCRAPSPIHTHPPAHAQASPSPNPLLALMTTAPNIEMIASSLQHCSLNGGGGDRRLAGRSGGGDDDDSESVTVELNSDIALPYHWEQCLDIRTGQVYYINWEDGRRTTVDPRTLAFTTSPTPRSTSLVARLASSPSSGFTSVSSVGAEASAWPQAGDVDSGYDNDNEEEDDEKEGEEESSSTTSSSLGSVVSSTLSSFSPTDESASVDNGSAIATGSDNNNGGTAGHVLVAAGCRACFMYFMVPKGAEVCPKCGSSGLLHLSRNGYA